MKKIIILCLLLASLALAQRQRVVVLPTLATKDTKLTPEQKEQLTNEVRAIAAKLPTDGFYLVKQNEVNEVLGDEAFVNACEDRTCVGQLVKQMQANFGARCDVSTVEGKLYLKFELYGTLKGLSEAQTIDQFSDPVKNFAEMQALIKKKVPAIFEKITRSPQDVCEAGGKIWENEACKTKEQIAKEVCQSEGKNWIDGDCKSRAQIVCEVTAGKKWVGEECAPSQPSSASQQSVASVISDGVLADARDGKKYKTVKIGNQTWMAENLNYEAPDSKCYDNNSANCAKYGRLYDFETAMKVCPPGWHLPSKEEYEILDKAVGGEKVAGKKLKSKSGWNNNGNGTDEFGFSALPGGFCYSVSFFYYAGNIGYWWSSSEYVSGRAHSLSMYYNLEPAYWYDFGKDFLFSVRCLQN